MQWPTSAYSKIVRRGEWKAAKFQERLTGFAERTVILTVGDRCDLKVEQMRGYIYTTKNM